jgi:peroxiredoxin
MFEEVWRAQRDQGVTFVGVALQDDELSLKSFLQSFKITYPSGLDQGENIARAYQVVGLPTTVVISPSGTLVRKWQGPIDREHLLDVIAEARTT